MAEADDGIFLIDGEDAGTTPWEFDSITEGGSATFELDNTNPNHGTYSYRAVTDGVSGNDSNGVIAWVNTDKDELWWRFYIYCDSTLSTGAYSTIPVVEFYDDTTFLGRFQLKDVGIGGGSINGWEIGYTFGGEDDTTDYVDNTWIMIEIKWIRHASAGGFELYINGVSVASDLDQDTSLDYPDNLKIGLLPSAAGTATAYIDIDDFKCAESQIGPYSEAEIGNPWYYYEQQ